jgi:hypothetical protein
MVRDAIRAQVDPALSVRVIGLRDLNYTAAASPDDDRPAHVRAASGLAFSGGRLVVIQDDAAFVGTVAPGEISAIPLPRGIGGRRRFEVGLGNKQDKLDLEACVAIDDEVWAIGSGSSEMRERIALIGYATKIVDASALYRKIRDELGHAINLEGVARVGEQLWMFHRGNTGAGDRGPAVIKIDLASFKDWLHGSGPTPTIAGSIPYDLGMIEGFTLGFTDAVGVGAKVYFLAAAEASPNAIDDGRVLGSVFGVIARDTVRVAPLSHDGAPLKAEGLAIDPKNPRHAWVAIDPDDVEQPARLYEIELAGPW